MKKQPIIYSGIVEDGDPRMSAAPFGVGRNNRVHCRLVGWFDHGPGSFPSCFGADWQFAPGHFENDSEAIAWLLEGEASQ